MSAKISARQADRLAQIADQPQERSGNVRGAATDDSLLRRGLVERHQGASHPDMPTLPDMRLHVTAAGRAVLGSTR